MRRNGTRRKASNTLLAKYRVGLRGPGNVRTFITHYTGCQHLSPPDDFEEHHRSESSYGTFTRSFSWPSSSDAEHVAVEYKDGQLILTMPKREEAKPKAIKINVEKK